MLAGLGLLAGCARKLPAPVVYDSKVSVSREAVSRQVAKRALSASMIGPGEYMVGADETLYAVARRSGVALRDLITANDLSPPYRLTRGQRLRIPGIRYHRVTAGQTLYGISRQYRVSPYALARENRVPPPYVIRPGQKLRLPASEAPPKSIALDTSQPDAVPRPRQKPSLRKTIIKPPPKRGGSRFAWPVRGRVISRFGGKPNGLHNDGINIAVKAGTSVRAADNGVVVYAGNELRGFGNLLLLRHRGGWVTAYGHNQVLNVKLGDVVRRGQQIAKSGSTGNINRPQLHFEIRKGRRAVNPVRHLASRQASIDPNTHAAGQILDELPGHPAVAGAAGHGPFDGLGPQIFAADGEAKMLAIAVQHGEEFVLAAIVETQPQTKSVR
ncbi:MAG: M23 family metallopeptidase [Rhodospirillaceae bacterium]|nr:M23 family metallopeptidase [Rhodospirillaceae bacterium]